MNSINWNEARERDCRMIDKRITCIQCGGSGQIRRDVEWSIYQELITCRNCGGSGETVIEVCNACGKCEDECRCLEVLEVETRRTIGGCQLMSYEGDYRCSASEAEDDRCGRVATQVRREPFTPGRFKVLFCDEHADPTYEFDAQATSELLASVEREEQLEAV